MGKCIDWTAEESESYAEAQRKIIKLEYQPLAKKLSEYIGENKTLKIADIGCGPGMLPCELAKLKPEVQFMLLDSSEQMITIAKHETEKANVMADVRQCGAEKLLLDDGSVDYTIAKHLLIHTEDMDACFREMFRVLKSGGVALLIDFSPKTPRLVAYLKYMFGLFIVGRKWMSNYLTATSKAVPEETVVNSLNKAGFHMVKTTRHKDNYIISAQKS